MTRTEDGTEVEALRWAGPRFIVDGSGWGIASGSTEVVLAHVTRPSNELVISRVSSNEAWPPNVEPVVHHPTGVLLLETVGASMALGSDRSVVLAAWGLGLMAKLVEGASVSTSHAIQVAVSMSAAPALFTLGAHGESMFVERRGRVSFATRAEELMRFKAARTTSHQLFALHDGCAVLVHKPGAPLVIHHVGDATKPRKLRSKILPVGNYNYLVPRTGGAWLVSGTIGGKPTEVHKLVGPDLEPEGPPYVLPWERFDRPLGACAVGDQLAILIGGAAFSVALTDGVTSLRTEGSVGYGVGNMREMGMAADPSGRAVWVMLRQGPTTALARVDLLRAGDPRLALPVYSEPDPSLHRRAPEAPVQRPECSLAHYVRQVRLHHLLRSISAVHHPVLGVEHGMKREGDIWRTWSMDGSGNHHLIAWNATALLAVAFDHDQSRVPTSELLDGLPPSAEPLAKMLLSAELPEPNGAQWVIRVDGHDVLDGPAFDADELAGYAEPTERALEGWTDLYGVSADQVALAVRLRDASAGYTLTVADVAIILAPADAERAAPNEDGVSRGRSHFAEMELVWPRDLGGIGSTP